MGTQSYIGIPNGMVVCIDKVGDNALTGRYYHGYSKDEFTFGNEIELLNSMEDFFNKLSFPFPGNSERSFTRKKETTTRRVKKEIEKVMKDEELLSMHGELGTFIIRVQHRQNSSWQGRITWVEQDKTLYFRSIWEMMKLIDSAMEQFKDQDEDNDTPQW